MGIMLSLLLNYITVITQLIIWLIKILIIVSVMFYLWYFLQSKDIAFDCLKCFVKDARTSAWNCYNILFEIIRMVILQGFLRNYSEQFNKHLYVFIICIKKFLFRINKKNSTKKHEISSLISFVVFFSCVQNSKHRIYKLEKNCNTARWPVPVCL